MERLYFSKSVVDRNEAGVGYNYLNARYYEGTTGRFISQDPSFLALGDEQLTRQNTGKSMQEYLMDPQSLNSYSYANNNPITKTDPNGKSAALANSLLGTGVSLEGIGLGFDSTIFGAPAGLVIGGADLVVLGIGGLVHYFSKSDTDSAKSGENKPTIQPAPKPEDIQGKSPEEIGEMMKEKGWGEGQPSRGGGTKWPSPTTKGEQVRVEPGKPTNSDPVKQGPYGRISKDGSKGDHIPLKGNPTLKP